MSDQEADKQREILQPLPLGTQLEVLVRVAEVWLKRREGFKCEEIAAELRELLEERGVRRELRELLERREWLSLRELRDQSEWLERREWPKLRERLERLERREGPDAIEQIQLLVSHPAWKREVQGEQPSELEPAAPISLYFDLGTFSPTDITDIVALLSELYADVGGDSLVIDDVTLPDFQPVLLPTEV